MLSLLVPYSPIATFASAEDTKVCCDASEVDLNLLGDGNKQLSPFDGLLSETATSVSFETSVAVSYAHLTLPTIYSV